MEHQTSTLDYSPVLVALPEDRGYPIYFGGLDDLPMRMRVRGLTPGACFVVTDENVASHYLGPLLHTLRQRHWRPEALVLPAGEGTKSMVHLARIQTWALENGIDRRRPVIALGGGVVGDLAGFAAATTLRGVPLVQVPTSLVAQVDSAIGGKTGINHRMGKNLIGAFYQPRFVQVDQAVLATLPEREWTSGLAEVVKYAYIADAAFFDFLDAHWDALLAREPDAVAHVLRRSAEVKADVVSRDEREGGRRALLNFGHTFAHAIEKAAGYGTFTHGEAVAVGMRAALHLSHTLRQAFPLERADALAARLPVPGSLDAFTNADLIAAMQSDKKRQAGRLRFIVLDEIGAARVTDNVALEAVEAAWDYARAVSR
ncbi:MAG: 3-dehydroquinate synthase [Bacteroidota bacterium]